MACDPLVARLGAIVGRRGVVTGAVATRRFVTGYRTGAGTARAVVRPRTLIELWRVLQACVEARAPVIMQAANTGLTGGSTPPPGAPATAIVVNAMRIDGILPLDGGRQVVCLPGARLDRLEKLLAPLGRDPHSVIGSSCIGASVIGGVCNNSGGALVRRGPAFTELALFARVDADGVLHLVNHLGIALGDEPEGMLARLERGDFTDADVRADAGRASDHDYATRVRDLGAAQPARFNAHPGTLHEASGCAGKLAVFAVRLDTFAKDRALRTFYLGTNDPDEFTHLRRALLGEATHLPVSAEYIHRDAFALAERYGRDTVAAIARLGTRRIPALFRAKAAIDAVGERLHVGPHAGDRLLQAASRLLPIQVPPRLREWHRRFEHHLILTVADDGIDEARPILRAIWPSATGDMFECTPAEASRAYLHRFAVAGAAVRCAAVAGDGVGEVVALDIAHLPSDTQWHAPVPAALAGDVRHALIYGHFLCHVFHRDYLLRPGADAAAVKASLLGTFEAQGAKYPAEHNVGHHYHAEPVLRDFYDALDPTGFFNPGIGRPGDDRSPPLPQRTGEPS